MTPEDVSAPAPLARAGHIVVWLLRGSSVEPYSSTGKVGADGKVRLYELAGQQDYGVRVEAAEDVFPSEVAALREQLSRAAGGLAAAAFLHDWMSKRRLAPLYVPDSQGATNGSLADRAGEPAILLDREDRDYEPVIVLKRFDHKRQGRRARVIRPGARSPFEVDESDLYATEDLAAAYWQQSALRRGASALHNWNKALARLNALYGNALPFDVPDLPALPAPAQEEGGQS